jgi:hypothetical protein
MPRRRECPQCATKYTDDELILQRGVCHICGYRCLPLVQAKTKPRKYYCALSGSFDYVEHTIAETTPTLAPFPMPTPLSREFDAERQYRMNEVHRFMYETAPTKELKTKYLPDLREMYKHDELPTPNPQHSHKHQLIGLIRKIVK